MRGKDSPHSPTHEDFRITPAYAGKSIHHHMSYLVTRDHPRLCGEKPVSRISLAAFPWITPAYAGKSEFPPAFTKVSRDHPRLCGEKFC